MNAAVLVSLFASLQAGQRSGSVTGIVNGSSVGSDQAVVLLVPAGRDTLAQLPETVLVRQRGLAFHPRLIVGRPELSVVFRNVDPVLHNVFGFSRPNARFELGTYRSPDSRTHTFSELGAYVILCHIHPEMLAYVVIVPTPHFAVTDREGRFQIVDLPPGAYSLRVWHPWSVFPNSTVRVVDGERVQVEIDPAPRRRR